MFKVKVAAGAIILRFHLIYIQGISLVCGYFNINVMLIMKNSYTFFHTYR